MSFFLEKNVASQKWLVYAFDETDNTEKTGDAAQITANIRKDGTTAATNDVNPTELEDGFYEFDLTQAETNFNLIHMFPASSTANIHVIGMPPIARTYPPNFEAIGVETDGHIHADVKQWLGTAPLALSSQRVRTAVESMSSGILTTIENEIWDGLTSAHSTADSMGERLLEAGKTVNEVHVQTSANGGNDSNGGTSPDDAKLTLAGGSGAISVAADGDTIVMGAGTFAEAANQMDIPAGVSLRGAGPHRTIITSDVLSSTGACMVPGDRSIIEDITVRGKHTWSADRDNWTGIGASDIQIAFGAGNTTDGGFGEVVCRRCVFEGTFDAVKLDDGDAGERLTIRFEDCHFYSGFDAVGVVRNVDAQFYNCRLESNGNWGDEASLVGVNERCISVQSPASAQSETTVLLFNCILIARNGTTTNHALDIPSLSTGTGMIQAIGCVLRTEDTGALDVDINDNGTVILSGTYYDPAKITIAGTGVFRVAESYLDLEQALDLTPTSDTVGEAVNVAAQKLVDGGFSAATFAAGAINAAAIATDAITAAKIAADAIGSSELATDAIGDAQIATGAIAATAFAANAIDAAATAADFIAEVRTQADDALVAIQLDHLLHVADASTTTNDSILAKMAASDTPATFASFLNTRDSLEAIKANTAWDTATGFSTLTAVQVNTEVDTALSDIFLDNLFAAAEADEAVNNSYWAKLISATGDASTFTAANESLEALRTQGDAAWITAAGTSTLTVAQVATELVDALRTDAGTELAAVPAAAPDLFAMVQWVYQQLRNERTSTSSASTVADDAGSAIGTSTNTDAAGTFTRGKFA